MNTYLKYIEANFAVEFFKSQIIKLDTENTFYKKHFVEEVDPEDLKAFKESEDYKLKITKVEMEIEIWKAAHKSYYRMQPCLPTSSAYKPFRIEEIKDLTLEEAIQGYKSANEALKGIENEELDPYCTETKPMLNHEHKPEYDILVKELKIKHEVPSDEEIKAGLPIKNHAKFRLSLDRQKSIDHSKFDLYCFEFEKRLEANSTIIAE